MRSLYWHIRNRFFKWEFEKKKTRKKLIKAYGLLVDVGNELGCNLPVSAKPYHHARNAGDLTKQLIEELQNQPERFRIRC